MIKFFLVIVLVGSWEDYSAILGGEGKISLRGDISIILIVCIWIYKFIVSLEDLFVSISFHSID